MALLWLFLSRGVFEHDYSDLEKDFELQNNDIVIIAFSNDSRHSEIGALAIASELNETLKKFISEI